MKCVFLPQVESPLAVEAVLGEAAFSVVDEKVSIVDLRVHAVSGLTLSLQPSPGNSHTMVAKATGLQTLSAVKQVKQAPSGTGALSERLSAPGNDHINLRSMPITKCDLFLSVPLNKKVHKFLSLTVWA